MNVTAMPEQWKPVFRYPLYEVSDTGKVRNIKTGKELSQWLNCGAEYHYESTRYFSVCLYSKKGRKAFTIHYLVIRMFQGVRPSNHHIHHKDGNRFNNNNSNLEYLLDVDHRSEHSNVSMEDW